jgi:hypothetical protein
MVLAGGSAGLKGFAEFIQAQTGMEVLKPEDLPHRRVPEQPALFATAAGLSLAGQRVRRPHVSLLPAPMRSELTFRRQKPYWIAAAVTAGLILAVSLLGGIRDIQRKERILQANKTSLSKRQQFAAQIESIKAANRELRVLADAVQDTFQAAPLMRNLVTLVAQSKHEGDWITLVSDAESYFKPPADPAKPGTPPAMRDRRRTPAAANVSPAPVSSVPTFDHIVIEGYTQTADFTTVKALIARLKAAEFVASADLLSDDKLVATAQKPRVVLSNAKPFVIEVKLASP